MAKSKNTNKTSKKSNWMIAGVVAGVLLLLYVIGLLNPLTGNYLKYPYYEAFCGRKPVVASDFMNKTYLTPDMKSYKVKNMGAVLYCTENEAMSNGYSKSLAQ